jgi:hypothetical protein
MSLRPRMEALYVRHVDELVRCPELVALEAGTAAAGAYDGFVASVIKAHLKSPQLLGFLFALAPPAAAERLKHNLLEELGIEEASGASHPSLLRVLAREAGLGGRLPELEALAAEDLRRIAEEPLLYGTLKEVGFAALVEVCAFEYMLSRVAGRIARALGTHRGLAPAALAWFTHHAEVDIAHAEQGFANLDAFASHYGMGEDDAMTIAEMTLRENVFIKRYFGELSLARAKALL